MKLISKHKDYYDYLTQIYGVDQVVVYKRLPTSIDHQDGYAGSYQGPLAVRDKDESLGSINITSFQLWFCDRNYPMLDIEFIPPYNLGNMSYPKRVTFYYYDYESFDKAWGKLINMSSYNREKLEEHFKTSLNYKLNSRYNSPQLTHKGNSVHTDIILKDYGFNKIMSPQQAYQRVFMFMNSKPDAPQVIPTDMHRFEAKGFDKKTSFRKRKET